jgi:hypothetical protein
MSRVKQSSETIFLYAFSTNYNKTRNSKVPDGCFLENEEKTVFVTSNVAGFHFYDRTSLRCNFFRDDKENK